jgi:hypothetical protein
VSGFFASGFIINQFPPSPDYTISAVSNFFENLWRFPAQGLPLLSLTRQQMEKIFNQKNLFDFFWTPLGSRVSI